MRQLRLIEMFILYLSLLAGCSTKSISQEAKSFDRENDIIAQHKEDTTKINILVGKWFTPHNADINIIFYKNGTFVFRDYNVKNNKQEIIKGTFELSGNKLILKYYDRLQQTFKFEKGKGIDNNYYITKGKDYYFVKTDVEDWGIWGDESDSINYR